MLSNPFIHSILTMCNTVMETATSAMRCAVIIQVLRVPLGIYVAHAILDKLAATMAPALVGVLDQLLHQRVCPTPTFLTYYIIWIYLNHLGHLIIPLPPSNLLNNGEFLATTTSTNPPPPPPITTKTSTPTSSSTTTTAPPSPTVVPSVERFENPSCFVDITDSRILLNGTSVDQSTTGMTVEKCVNLSDGWRFAGVEFKG